MKRRRFLQAALASTAFTLGAATVPQTRALLPPLSLAADTTHVTAVIRGKRVQFSLHARPRIVQRAVDLLASCAYMNTRPNWGAPAQPQTMAQAQKQSHLHLVFSTPRKVEVPIEKATVQAREMVITLPLAAAGIWVRTDDRVIYFAKFDCTVAKDFEKLVHEAQKP